MNEEDRRKFNVPYERPISNRSKHIVVLKYSRVFTKYWRLYCKHTTLVGLKYFLKDEVTWLEKFLWLLVYIISIICGFLQMVNIYQAYKDIPVTATLESEYFPTNEIKFPGKLRYI
ncbi:uncharacterized protein LOC122568742 [Bombus pyrosoma]|uniref:uncharacterized protein LOC122568742 n=1 Tax=Bombus pyrosoma TaxID=396416 RepID=UPI001CB8ADEE|nr:uncharacterized protein LOC122568742 [Bombus pyrosoma]